MKLPQKTTIVPVAGVSRRTSATQWWGRDLPSPPKEKATGSLRWPRCFRLYSRIDRNVSDPKLIQDLWWQGGGG